MQEGIESSRKFVVARGEATKLLEPMEESFNKIACLVSLPVIVTRSEAIASWRDDRLSAGGLNGGDEGVAVVALVRNDGIGRDGFHQGRSLVNVGPLTTGEDQSQRIAQGIHASVNLGRQTTPRAADRLIATVFFGAPAECWWARTTVESMNNSSRSASPWKASAMRDHTPPSSHRAKRTYTECQFPNSCGRSRHGLPTRAVYSTASTNSRLSAARPPLSVGLPGNKPSILAHCASLNIRRSICHIQIPGCKHKSTTVNSP